MEWGGHLPQWVGEREERNEQEKQEMKEGWGGLYVMSVIHNKLDTQTHELYFHFGARRNIQNNHSDGIS